ncbi:MAG: transposase [Deltaproteobacteria bacterium]|nr:transposase [Deltaproteobacteria bacterium]
MPRTARLHVPGGVFHLVSRFVRDEPVLDREGARDHYLQCVGAASANSDTTVLAYCLMSTHVHLVVVQGESPLERFTKSLHTAFARWVNEGRQRRAQGPVFAGRPRTLLVDADEYLLQLVRYVHNNPVRAGVARTARGSAWSSHRAYLGRVEAPEWLRIGYVLGRFGRVASRAAATFDAFVDEGRSEPRRPELSGALDSREASAVRKTMGDGHRVSDGVLGDDVFTSKVRRDAARVEAALSSRGSERRAGPVDRPTARQVIDAVLDHRGLDAIELTERPRSQRSTGVKRLATWVWVHEYEGRQVDIARALGLHTSVVSRHYGEALASAAEYDEEATAVTARLAKRKRRVAKKTAADADGFRVRYHVDVNET